MRHLLITTYFVLLGHLCLYGAHILWLVIVYLRSSPRPAPFPGSETAASMVTVQLPVFNERLVVIRLIRAVAAFEWPRDKIEIQVLDDSSDETASLIATEVSRLKQTGVNIKHLRRMNRDGFKAGALAAGLESATGEYIAIFDADNVPRSDFLIKTMALFTDAKIGLVQARWSFLNREESLLCRAQALFLDAHFHIEQAARCSGGLFQNFNGTAGIWRRTAIDAAGGWHSDTLTEDLDLSYRAQLKGWRIVFADEIDVPTELPNSVRAFKNQQFRWTKGSFETCRKLLFRVLRSDLPIRIKLASFLHLTQRTTSITLLLLALLLIPSLHLRIDGGIMKILSVDLPVFVAGTLSMTLYYGLAHIREKGHHSLKNSLLLPALSALGIGLAVNNSFALISAIMGKSSPFIRTPKTGSDAKRRIAVPAEYRIRADKTLRFEALLALYAASALAYAVFLDRYLSVPFLATFVFGFSCFAVLSLKERRE